MKKAFIVPVLLALTLAGCHSGPNTDNQRYDARTQTAYSRIQLSENDALKHSFFGRKGAGKITSSLKDTSKYSYHSGSKILVMQSGQESPDEALLAVLRKTYMPIPISGVRITLDACLRLEPEDLNYDYNDIGTGGAQNPSRWPVMRERGTSGNTGGSLDEAICNFALDSGADTIVIVWTSTEDPNKPAFRAAVINAKTQYWDVVSPYADTVGRPDTLTPESKQAAYDALAKILSAKTDGLSLDRSERD